MKLDEYIKKYGIKQKWLADQLEIDPATLSYYLKKKWPINTKHWFKIIQLTKNEVTIYDLLSNLVQDLGAFEVIKSEDGNEAKIKVKNVKR
jgi:predicted transcriptional regulator